MEPDPSEPLLTEDGNCPSCGSAEWKLKSVLVSEATFRVDTRSSGGGAAVSVGGQPTLTVGAIGFDTDGQVRSELALRHQPPSAPDVEVTPSTLEGYRAEAEAAVQDLMFFGERFGEAEPGFFTSEGRANSKIERLKKDYDLARTQLLGLYKHQRAEALWPVTRVCIRCGSSFVKRTDSESIRPQTVPEFTFRGIDQNCPKCHSYLWKDGTIYLNLALDSARQAVWSAEGSYRDSLAAAEANKGPGVWNSVMRFFSTSPESAGEEMQRARLRLNELEAESSDDFKDVRVCLGCKHKYVLATAPTAQHAVGGDKRRRLKKL